MKQRIERILFAPASPLGVIAARVILALQALWIVLSRPGMHEMTAWPATFWRDTIWALLRFGIVPGAAGVDHVLYWAMIVGLTAALFGVVPRTACLVSALLLYHFAPMEAIAGGLLYTASLSGLTMPMLGLLILTFANPARRGAEWSPEYRWPLVLIQIIFAFHYVNSGLAKLHFAGLEWYSADNFGGLAATLWTLNHPRLGLFVFQRSWLAGALGAATLVLEFGFPLTIFSKWARRILLPAAVLAFLLRIQVFGFFFLSFPSILLMVNWDAVEAWWTRPRRSRLEQTA